MTALIQPTALVLAYYYPPDNTSGVFRTLYFFNHIARRGKWNICILTLDPNCYQAEQNQDHHLLAQVAPQIRVYTARAVFPREALISLKKNPCRQENRDLDVSGEPTVSASSPVNNTTGWWQQCKDILTEEILAFPDNKIGWLPFAYHQARKIIKEQGINVIYSTGSPWSSHLLGYLLKKRTGLPLVLDYRDPWHGNPYEKQSHSKIYRRAIFRLEKTIITSADRVLCNTERLRKFYQQTFGCNEKFFTLTNGYEQVMQQEAPPGKEPKEFVLVHAGSLYGGRNPKNFFNAVVRLSKQSGLPKIRVILVGAGEEIRNFIAEKYGVSVLDDHFVVTPRVAHEQCLDYLRSADALLLFQQGTSLQVPRKLYEYIGLRKPILGICEEGETEDIILHNRLGLSVRDNEDAIEKALRTLVHSYENICPREECLDFSNVTLARQLELYPSEVSGEYA